MNTIHDLISRNGIKFWAVRTDSNTNMDANMDHWRCRISNAAGKRIVVTFSMGIGHHGKAPKLEEVIDCLASDASGVENARGFEEWRGEYGYDTDSRKAEKTYKACQRVCDQLKRLVGEDYQALLFDTERL